MAQRFSGCGQCNMSISGFKPPRSCTLHYSNCENALEMKSTSIHCDGSNKKRGRRRKTGPVEWLVFTSLETQLSQQTLARRSWIRR